jgi:large subunit ribosomal protein L29
MKSTVRKNEWKQVSEETLKSNLMELREKLRSLRFLSVSGKLKNVCESKELRKDIARLLTILKQKHAQA